MPLKRPQAGAVGQPPQPHGAVARGGGHCLVDGGEGAGPDPPAVALEGEGADQVGEAPDLREGGKTGRKEGGARKGKESIMGGKKVGEQAGERKEAGAQG